MATIPDTMRTIARDVQHAFEELMKLLLRKTLRPALNPLGNNTKVIYNTYKGKYERGLVGSIPDDNINKYSYIMTHDSLGWVDDSLTNFRVLAKFIKNNVPQRFPAGHAKIRNTILSKSNIAFSDKEAKGHLNSGRMPLLTQYKNFLTFLTSKSMQQVIANRKASFMYTSDVPYSHSFKQLEGIGKDVIDQTDPSIDGSDSAKMSTAMLRVKLYILDKDLGDLSVTHPDIFEAYVEMLRIINSIPRPKMIWVINLIASLSFQNWLELTPQQQKSYIDALGEDFICAFNSNELITILLQGKASEVILTSSYLYSLLKMLFIVFGYSKLIPIITDKGMSETHAQYQDRLRKHLDRYRGATFRRGDDRDPNDTTSDNYTANPCSRACDSDELCSDSTRISQCLDNNKPACPDFCPPESCKPECEPVDPCIYDFIKLFGDLYPTLVGLMGGTEVFPPECIEVDCNSIPSNYDCLAALPEYLWRFNDFAYCRYLDYVNSKQLHNALATKVNAKAKYLQTI